MLTTSSALFISKELDIVEHKKNFMNLMMCSFKVAVSLAMVCARGIYTFYMCILLVRNCFDITLYGYFQV